MPWGDHLLADGGVVNNTPISHAVELGENASSSSPRAIPARAAWLTRPRGPLDALVQACGVLVEARMQAYLVRYANEAELVVLSAPVAPGCSPTTSIRPSC